MLCVQDITILCATTAVCFTAKASFVWSALWKQLVAHCEAHVSVLLKTDGQGYERSVISLNNKVYVCICLQNFRHFLVVFPSDSCDKHSVTGSCPLTVKHTSLLSNFTSHKSVGCTVACRICRDEEQLDSGRNPWAMVETATCIHGGSAEGCDSLRQDCLSRAMR